MAVLQQLKARLIYSKVVAPEQMVQAEQHAAKGNISVDQALVDLGYAEYSQIGKCLCDVSEMPYQPLFGSRFPSQHASLVSRSWGVRWSIFPVSYERASHLLTIAVCDPDFVPKVQRLYGFLMEPYTLAFTIAPQCEIRKVLEQHVGVPASGPQQEPRAQMSAEERGSAPVRETRQATRVERVRFQFRRQAKDGSGQAIGRGLPPVQGRGLRPTEETRRQAATDDIGRYLTSAAALLVAVCQGENSQELNERRANVRYCQLLASRLNLSPDQVNRTVLAAWLSALADQPHIVRQFLTPYNLDEILFPKETDTEKLCVEGLILSLVSCYEDMKKRDPALSREVNLTRRNLHLLWSSSEANQDILEAFLQVLMDEQFLAKLDRSAGRILIVDHTPFSATHIAPLLTRDGYEVYIVPSVEAALVSIVERAPDLIIPEISLPQNSWLALCKKVKSDSVTANVPVMVLMGRDEEKRAAECLRAGADDFVLKPLDLELFFLKLHKLMRTPPADSSVPGVSGKLDDMNFTDMIQILCAGNKNMEVQLTSHGEEGHVFLKSGNVIHAVAGDTEGEDAFHKLMKWQEGNFTMKPCAQFPPATIQVSTMSLLLEGARLADEADKAVNGDQSNGDQSNGDQSNGVS